MAIFTKINQLYLFTRNVIYKIYEPCLSLGILVSLTAFSIIDTEDFWNQPTRLSEVLPYHQSSYE